MGKYIYVDKEDRKKLCKTFHTVKSTVSEALSFKTNSKKSKQIRHTALTQLNGEWRIDLPIAETIHDHAGFMTQVFENGVVLTVNKNTGYTTIVNKYGDLIKEEDIKSLNDLDILQEFAAGR